MDMASLLADMQRRKADEERIKLLRSQAGVPSPASYPMVKERTSFGGSQQAPTVASQDGGTPSFGSGILDGAKNYNTASGGRLTDALRGMFGGGYGSGVGTGAHAGGVGSDAVASGAAAAEGGGGGMFGGMFGGGSAGAAGAGSGAAGAGASGAAGSGMSMAGPYAAAALIALNGGKIGDKVGDTMDGMGMKKTGFPDMARGFGNFVSGDFGGAADNVADIGRSYAHTVGSGIKKIFSLFGG